MEFKVRTKKLKGSTGAIRATGSGLRSARATIDNVIKSVNIGSSTDEVRSALRKSTNSLNTIETAAGKMRTNLQAIASQYEVTELAIKNQQKKKLNLGAATTSIAALPGIGSHIRNIWGKGKKWWNKHVGDPVAVDSGNFILEINDLEFDPDDLFKLTRFYNSNSDSAGALGNGWIHNFEMSIRVNEGGAVVTLGDGSEEGFRADSDRYIPVSGTAELEYKDGIYRYITLENDVYCFDAQGQLIRSEDANGYGYTLEYSTGSLTKVTKDSGEFFEFAYAQDNSGHVETITDHTGRSVVYKYNGRNLVSVQNGDRVVKYEYDRAGNLTDVTDPRGVVIVHNEYDDEGRVVRQFFPDGSEMRYSYDEENDVSVVTEKDGSESYHFHDELLRNTDNVYRDGTQSFEYNEKNLITSDTDRNGNETKYQYDNRGNVSKISLPNGAVINMTYEKHNKPVSVSVNGVRRLKNVYDSKGNLLESTDALRRRTTYRYNDMGLPVEITLPGDKVISMAYDDRGNIINVLDEHGVRYAYEYDDLNRLILSRDGMNNTTVLEYDRYGKLTCVTDAAGNSRVYKYNEINKISEMKDFNGAVTHLSYNKLGLPCEMTDPLGRVTELEYDCMWNAAVEKLPNGGVRRIDYDEYGRPLKETDPVGNETLFDYDGNGNMISRTDPEGAVTEFKYNSINKLIYVRDPEGNETRYDYDKNGNLTYIRNANGGEVRMEYDDADQLIREIDPFGQTREYMYTPDGDIARVIDEAGRIATFEYASPGKPSRVVLPDGQEELLTYDRNGNVRTRANKQGLVMTYEYDAFGNITEAAGNNGERFTYTYDAVGNLTSAADGKGNTTRYEYTLTGQLSKAVDELGNLTEYVYDAMDELVGIRRHGEGEVHQTEYVRDLNGRVTEVIDPLGFTEKYMYNGRGELTQAIDKDGYLTKYGYDGNGELASVRYDDGREILMKHDALLKLQEIIDWTGTTSVESDILGRVTKVTYPDNRTAEYTYGKTGERTSIKHPDGRTVHYGYDKALRLTSLTEGETDIRYGYDEAGQIISKTFASGLAVKYAYDTSGRVTELINTHKGRTLDTIRVAYDITGNKESVERMRDGLPDECGVFRYGYDPAGRLTSVSRDGTVQRQYEYDAFGNRTALVSDGIRTEYSYDAMDRLIESRGAQHEAFRYDKRGNLTERIIDGAVANAYSYNPMNRLAKAVKGPDVATYEYSGLGQRIEDRILSGTGSEQIIRYTSDLTKYSNNLLERNVNGASDAFLWDGIAAAVKGQKTFEFASDEMGSPIRLLGMDGSNAEVYGYDEFGTSLYEEDSLQPIRYMGYRNDPVADMYFVQAREYMPENGRFAAQDSLKGNTANPATLNPYIYCGDMPLMYYDPDGLFWNVVIGAAIGGVVSGGFELGSQLVGQVKSGGLKNVSLKKVNWGKVGTSALGGAVEGGLVSAGCPPAAAAGISGFVEGFTEAKLVDGKGWGESLANGAVSGATGFAFAKGGELFEESKLGKKLADCKLNNNKLTKYFDKFGDNFERQMTRARNKGIHLGWRTVRNGLVSGIYDGLTDFLKPKKWLDKGIEGAINCALGLA